MGIKESYSVNEINVYKISNCPFEKEKCNIIFTVKKNGENIISLLKEQGYLNITNLNSQKNYIELLNIYYDKYFKDNSIEITNKEMIKFKELKIINPFYISKEIGEVFLSEIGDLILPLIMNDYSRIDEGSYEYGHVILEEGDVVFDCGANIGLFLSIAAFKSVKCILLNQFKIQ